MAEAQRGSSTMLKRFLRETTQEARYAVAMYFLPVIVLWRLFIAVTKGNVTSISIEPPKWGRRTGGVYGL